MVNEVCIPTQERGNEILLLAVLQGEMSRSKLMAAIGLSDRKSFRERYLLPALEAGLIKMTLPDKPNSRLQKYRRSK